MSTKAKTPKIGFIGAGTVGTALARSLAEAGYAVVAVASQTFGHAQTLASYVPGCRAWLHPQAVADLAELIFITTPDDAVSEVVSQVSWHPGQWVVHTSGADSSDVLEPARRLGAYVGAFHPLQSFVSVEEAMANLPGTTFAIEGEGELAEALKAMAEALGGRWVHLRPEDKVLYHAAAVIASNYTVTLAKLATDLWETLGVERGEALRALLPLLKGTIHNLETQGLPDALTGPIVRGDVGTVRKHLEVLERSAPWLLPIYKALGLQTIPVALAKGKLKEEGAAKLRVLLSDSVPVR